MIVLCDKILGYYIRFFIIIILSYRFSMIKWDGPCIKFI